MGIAQVVEGGFITNGHRKVVPTIELSAKQILDKKMNACRLELSELQKLMQTLSKPGVLPAKY